jgi:hypothetical protein
MGVSSSLAADVYTFGSDNDGLAGFTQSTPVDSNEIWTTQPAGVQYRNQDNGTRNSSFLRAIPLDRSPGRSYRIEGIVTLTDGYTDDNNRVGQYLFGDSAEVPNEDEVGAIGLIFNSDDGSATGPPGNDSRDYISLRVGIDSTGLSGNELRNQDPTPYAQDLFGTTITLTADIEFINDGTDDFIQIDATLTDADGAETTTSISVLAADYTGDYFGFVTRARARNYVDGGENTAAGQSLPWVMDYKSFSVSGLSLAFTPNEGTPGSYDFTWTSKSGKVYDLVSDTVLTNPISAWPVWQENSEILPSGTGTNTLIAIPGGGAGPRFFSVVEREPLPLFAEDFNAAGPDLPAGWVAANAMTVWEVGDPFGLPNLQDGDGTNCAGTNVAGNYADEVATVTLTSPAVSIPTVGAALSFRQYIDSDAPRGDVGAIRLLDATDTEIVEGDFPITGIDGVTLGWTAKSYPLPASADGQNVKVVFEFATQADGLVFSGFYIDDVQITAN